MELSVEHEDIIEALKSENQDLRDSNVNLRATVHRLMRQLNDMVEEEQEEE